jgi:magnesium chelatase family protein
MAPADLKKEGSGLDLPLALGLLAGTGHLPPEALAGCGFLGELGLNGELRSVRGGLPMARACCDLGVRALFLPIGNAREAAAGAEGEGPGRGRVRILGASTLEDVVAHLRGDGEIAEIRVDPAQLLALPPSEGTDIILE